MSKTELRPDIAEAANKLSWKLGSKREINKLEQYLWEGETVEMLATGSYGKGQGLLALTDRRLLFLVQGWTSEQLEDFPLGKISSVQWSGSFGTGTITVYASGNRADITGVMKDNGKAIADRLRARLNDLTSTSGSVVHTPASNGTPLLAEIQQLASLRESGALTDEEFTAAKSKLLG